ncbi:FecR domain-containing protein [uncultured Brachyspira sp.]|uniref:FecR domain-containing protein n=1 Tax=uncultured Brachyspira sp. TaxID=221953 RepID=UPI00260E9D63|nr:FecR domain-containing protein [uncultured Brachyspira sp.]
MVNRLLFLLIILALSFSSLFSQDISFKVTGISGLAFIEKMDINKSLRAFRGSEIHREYRLRTTSNTQVEVSLTRRGDKIGEIIVPQNTILLVNAPIYKDDNRVSLSLLEGYIKVNITKDLGSSVEVHTANTSSVVKGTEFEVAFAEDGSTIVVLSEGNIDVFTDKDEAVLNPKQAYINTIYDKSSIVKQSTDSDPVVFLNRGEEVSREDYINTLETLLTALESVSYEDDYDSFTSLVSAEDGEKAINNMEMKQYRMVAANEGYYNTIIKLINLDETKKNEMIPYARKSLTFYTANQRAINKMNSKINRTRDKFDRIKKKFDERMASSISN